MNLFPPVLMCMLENRMRHAAFQKVIIIIKMCVHFHMSSSAHTRLETSDAPGAEDADGC